MEEKSDESQVCFEFCQELREGLTDAPHSSLALRKGSPLKTMRPVWTHGPRDCPRALG